ncbi:MAG: ATP-binding cassette domain-containing protein [Thermaerobacter sp.]|nr:ATP-binding cassette domain-containing protein [Thermaerobacter sp.]
MRDPGPDATPPQDAALAISGLMKSYGRTRALEDVTLQCRAGTVHALLGENGTGKSTLVKVLAGVLAQDGGTVSVAGRPMTPGAPAQALDAGVVAVFQEVLVAPNLTGLQNLFLGYDRLFSRRGGPADRREMAEAIMQRIARVPVDLDQAVGEMPLISRQLIVIARAFLRDPAVLILDEATAALDMSSRDALFETIREFVDDGKLAVFITHRMDEVEAICDDITILRAGRNVATMPRASFDAQAALGIMSPEIASRTGDGGGT